MKKLLLLIVEFLFQTIITMAQTDTLSYESINSYFRSKTNIMDFYRLAGNTDKVSELTKERDSYIDALGDNYDKGLFYYYLSKDYNNLGQYMNAIEACGKTIDIYKRVLGEQHVELAKAFNCLAEYNFKIENYTEAVRLNLKAKEIWCKRREIDNVSYAMVIGDLARCYNCMGNYKEALRLSIETVEIMKRVLGTDHYDYAASLSLLASCNRYLQNYNEAIRLGTEALEIYKNVLGMEHPIYATSLNNLANYYAFLGNYSEAIRLGSEAMEIIKKVLGTNHPEYAESLNDLANYYSSYGYYTEAITILKEAIDIKKKALGNESLSYAMSLCNLADCIAHFGNYPEAIWLGTEAMEIRKKILGPEHPDYAMSVCNLASYYSSLGNYTEAIRLVIEGKEIYKKIFGTENTDYAMTLNNLSNYYSYIGNYSEAQRYGIEAMEIRKNILGTEHIEYATSLANVASDYYYLGNYAEALYLGTKAMKIWKKVFGEEHSDYVRSLCNLSNYNKKNGNYPEAIRLITDAIKISKKILGEEHPDYAFYLGKLSTYYYSYADNYSMCYDNIVQALDITQKYIFNSFSELSSGLQESLWTGKFDYWYNNFFPSTVYRYQTKESVSELYDKTILFAKGILQNSSIGMRQLILESGDSLILSSYDLLAANRSIYEKQMEKPAKKRFIDIDSLNSVIQWQEMELARASKVYGDYAHNLRVNWKDVQQKLGNDDIAIEFIDFPLSGTDSTMYVALTLKKEYDSPHMMTLFEKNQLKVIPEEVYYTQTDVCNLVWKPLEEELNGVTNIYFAPSGELHKIAIEYLPINKTETVNDVYTLHRLSSTRQLAVIQNEIKGKNTILYGGINYDEKSKTLSIDSVSTKRTVIRSGTNVDSLLLRNSYDYLEGTKREADLIADYMKQHSVPYNYYCGSDATEESFKNLDGTRPIVMHIATHGFYYTEAEAKKSQFASPEIELLTEGGQNVGRLVEYKPMTRSGLLFSGCNHAIRHEQIQDGEENGILTAQEISTLDLRGLDLVVLSACQTGLGDIISGEGVFGLQRGFKKAGAKTIIMSLWNVNDDSTMKMMTSFYHHYFEGMSKEKAFHTAQDELRKSSPFQKERPDWAAFIMLDGIN
jgi:CHAT domain-containing protein